MVYRSTMNLDAFLALLSPEDRECALVTLAKSGNWIRTLPAGASRARWVHGKVDEAQARLAVQKPEILAKVRCGKGCAHCCRVLVGITLDEADLLAEGVRAGLAHPDPARMEVQRRWESPLDFIDKPTGEASCVFLGTGDVCTVYEDRPSVCRALLVASDPELCRAGDKPNQTTTVLNPNLEVIVSVPAPVDWT